LVILLAALPLDLAHGVELHPPAENLPIPLAALERGVLKRNPLQIAHIVEERVV
jgi:hypothetical protein